MVAPAGGPLPPVRTLALVAVPLVLTVVTWANGGWSGWVLMVAVLASLGVAALLAPGWSGWASAASVAGDTRSPEALRRVLTGVGATLLVLAIALAWSRTGSA